MNFATPYYVCVARSRAETWCRRRPIEAVSVFFDAEAALASTEEGVAPCKACLGFVHCRAHVIARAEERFGVTLTWAEVDAIERACRDGAATCLLNESFNRRHYSAALPDGSVARVVVNTDAWRAVTVLPLDFAMTWIAESPRSRRK